MKKIIIFVSLIVLSLTLFTGCSKSKLSEYAGTYKLEYSKFVGDSDTEKDTKEVAEIILNDDGTGKSNRNGVSYSIKWNIDGENINISELFMGTTIEYNGTLKNDRLDLFNGDKTNALTNETVYNKVK